MAEIALCRCFHHPVREAVGRCRACERYYCRECVTEHEGRLFCALCLAKEVGPRVAKGRSLARITGAVGAVSGFLLAWLFFYLVGRILLLVPSSFHEGTLWKG